MHIKVTCRKLSCSTKQSDHAEHKKMHILEGFVGKQYAAIMAQPVTARNMDQLRKAFISFDKNSDGFISKQELSEAMKNFGYIITPQELEQMVNLVDKDGNGLVDFEEFLNLMGNNCMAQSFDQEMETLFQMIDVNKDGYITKKEIEAMMKSQGEKVRKKDLRKMMKEADLNNDGKISFSEFKMMVTNGNLLTK